MSELRESVDLHGLSPDLLSRRLFGLWRYRQQANINHLVAQFSLQALNKDDYPILHLYLTEQEQVLSLRYLYHAIEWQMLLSQKFDKKIDREFARNNTVGSVLKELPREEIRRWELAFEGFKNAWNLAWKYVDRYTCMTIPEDWQSIEMTSEIPLCFCLADERDEGICSLALLNYLVDKHNRFFDLIKDKLYSQFEFKLPSRMIKESHTINFKIEDFLPYLQRQTEQQLIYGTGSSITYDFGRIQQYIIDTFLTGVPQVDLEVRRFEFSNETRVTGALNNLKQKIKQTKLTEDMRQKILQDLSSLQQINRVKRLLEVAIGFLSSTGGSTIQQIPGEEYLSTYISDTLLLSEGLNLGNTIEKHVRLQHIVSLWEFLEDQLNVDPFEKVLPKYRNELDQYLKQDIEEVCRLLDLDLLLPIMKEMLLSYFTEGTGSIGARIKLKDTMAFCIVEDDLYLGNLEWFKLYFPSHIECSHALATYRSFVSMSKLV